MKPTLVKCCPKNIYRRYVDGKKVMSIQSDTPLPKEEIEIFRSNPESFEIEPEVA